MSRSTPQFLLFLDFDGVLHPIDASAHEQFNPRAIAIINRVLDRLEAKLVLSTAWRMDSDLERFNSWFQGRIIGATPTHALDLSQKHTRFREILAFLDQTGWSAVPWLAIDDKAGHFPDHAPAFITDRSTGLVEADELAILTIGKCMRYAAIGAREGSNR